MFTQNVHTLLPEVLVFTLIFGDQDWGASEHF